MHRVSVLFVFIIRSTVPYFAVLYYNYNNTYNLKRVRYSAFEYINLQFFTLYQGCADC